ncbi:hypothetical protein DHODJN_19125 [Methylorubrum extorquens]
MSGATLIRENNLFYQLLFRFKVFYYDTKSILANKDF